MMTNQEKKLAGFLKIIIVLLSLYYIAIFIFISLSRINYPFELEMMEGGMLENVIRLIEGKAIYTEPGIDYIPFIYPPLYFHLSEISVKIFGESFFSLRLISLISTLIAFYIIFAFVKKETGNWIYSISSVGIFAAVFQITGFWFDLARVDSLFLMFLLSTIYFLRFYDNYIGLFLSAVLALLAFLTKQTMMIIILPIILYLLINYKLRAFIFILPFLTGTIISTLWINHNTNGWYMFWMFELPASHEWNFKYLLSFWSYDVFKHTSIMFLFSLIWFIYLLKENDKKTITFYVALMLGIISAAWSQRLHLGGFVNANIPFYAIFSLTFLVGLNSISKKIEIISVNKNTIMIIFFIIIICQLLALNYNPLKAIPTKEDLIAGRKIIEKIKKIDGEIFIPNHNYLLRLAGKKTYAHWVGFLDLMISKSPWKQRLEKDIEQKFSSAFFKAIIVNDDFSYHFLEKYYVKKEAIFDNQVFMTISQKARPQYIYIPKK